MFRKELDRAVRKAVDEQKLVVEQTTQDIDACVKEMRDGEAKTRDEMREIRDEVASIREMLPKVHYELDLFNSTNDFFR